MQAVILAAGRGTRMQALTNELPKPLLQVAGRTLLEHKFHALPEAVTEIVLVVGYQGDLIREQYGDSWMHLPIRYVTQEVRNGTAGALWCAKDILTDRFMVMMGDDLYGKNDMERCIESPDWSVLIKRTLTMAAGGSVVVHGEVAHSIEEGDHTGRPGIMNTNLFVLDTRVFETELEPLSPGADQYGLPQNVLKASHELGIPVRAIDATFWAQLNAPEDLEACESYLRNIEEEG